MVLKDIVDNPYFTLGLAILAVLGVILAVVFGRKAIKKKIPVFEIKQKTLIRNDEPILPGLKVLYNNSSQGLITVAHIWLWNRGREIIDRIDVANPLLLRVSGGAEVLSAQVIKASQPYNNAKIGDLNKEKYFPEDAEGPIIFDEGKNFSYVENTIIPISFDFLEKGDGMLIQVVHNGEDNHGIAIEGKIKGVSNIRMNHPRRKLFSKWHSLAPMLMMLAMLASFQANPIQLDEKDLINISNKINKFTKANQSVHIVESDKEADNDALRQYTNTILAEKINKIRNRYKLTKYIGLLAGCCYIIYEILYWFLSFVYNIPKELKAESIN